MMESMAPAELQAVGTPTSAASLVSSAAPENAQSAHLAHATHAHNTEMALYDALAQKEKDLTLAAELGKALLEKNEDLTRENHELSMEYAAKIEVGHRFPDLIDFRIFF